MGFFGLTTLIFLADIVAMIAAVALLLTKHRVAAAVVFGATVLVNAALLALFVFFWPM